MGMQVHNEIKMNHEFACITFDLDDTLWPISPTIQNAEAALYTWLGMHYPRVTSKYSLQDLAKKREQLKQQRKDIAHDVTALRLQSLLEVAMEFGCSEKLARDGLEYFRTHRNRVTPYKEAEPTLARLSKHFTLGAITNGNAQLEFTELARYFDFCVTPTEVGECKPHPDIFTYAARLAGVQVSKILHVGDCAKGDVVGAANAGFTSVWLNANRKPWPGGQNPYAVIHSISELLDVLGMSEKTNDTT